MDEHLTEFLTECFDSMTVLDAELLQLERQPDDPELVASIFRLIHTIKGTCGFLHLSRLETMAHAAETVLGKLRDREMAATPAVVTLVLEAIDRVKDILDGLANDAVEPAGNDGDLIAALDTIAQQARIPAADGRRDALAAVPGDLSTEPPPHPTAGRPGPTPTDAAPARPAAKAGPRQPGGAGRGVGAERLAGQTLRVPVELLEQLTTLVGELALTRRQLLQSVRQGSGPALTSPLQRLDHITSELQAAVSKTRMQAIGTAWSKLPRLVRDLALELDKVIELEMQGGETEVDRRVVAMIIDPLTHMVRNAADHGLERPAERRRQGKPGRGTIGLNACHEGAHIVIEIRDDGKGLDTRRIAEQAVARGLVAEADIDAMTEVDIQKLILHPGVSTAAAVTAVSGRGVGMDVARRNVEKLGGSIEISSKAGQGTVFTMKIPLAPRPRIDAIAGAALERAGGQSMVQCRDGLMPLAAISSATMCDWRTCPRQRQDRARRR